MAGGTHYRTRHQKIAKTQQKPPAARIQYRHAAHRRLLHHGTRPSAQVVSDDASSSFDTCAVTVFFSLLLLPLLHPKVFFPFFATSRLRCPTACEMPWRLITGPVEVPDRGGRADHSRTPPARGRRYAKAGRRVRGAAGQGTATRFGEALARPSPAREVVLPTRRAVSGGPRLSLRKNPQKTGKKMRGGWDALLGSNGQQQAPRNRGGSGAERRARGSPTAAVVVASRCTPSAS